MTAIGRHRKRILIVVKTYPTPSKKYEETVCTAGVTDDGQWIRLHPIHFRDLPSNQRYRKYAWIEIDVEKHNKDLRPESFRPFSDTIQITEYLDTSKEGWRRRKEVLLPLASQSLEQLESFKLNTNTSLGMFKPKEILSFDCRAEQEDWDPRKKIIVDQQTMFTSPKSPLEKIPYSFHYRFRCFDPACKGHDLEIIDWEIYQSYRDWRWRYPDRETLIAKLTEKWRDIMFHPSRDPYFIVGTHSRWKTWMIIGVFWPPKGD